jgi:hypothetical protein
MAIVKRPPKLGHLPDTSVLWRLGAWGGAATLALVTVVLLTQTNIGAKRLQLVFAPEVATTHTATQADLTPQVDRQDADALRLETERLQAQVQELTADRDRLRARVASVERSLSDMTGSIKRELALVAATAPKPPPTLSAPETAAPSPAGRNRPQPAPAATQTGRAERAEAESKLQARFDSNAGTTVVSKISPQIIATTQSADAQSPTVRPGVPQARVAAIDAKEELAAAPAKPELGIDLGGAHTMEILQARWIAVKANFGPLIEGLHPLVVHDRRPHVVPYRLLVGPLPNGAAAAQMCSRFAASRVSCRTTKFVGEQLAQP